MTSPKPSVRAEQFLFERYFGAPVTRLPLGHFRERLGGAVMSAVLRGALGGPFESRRQSQPHEPERRKPDVVNFDYTYLHGQGWKLEENHRLELEKRLLARAQQRYGLKPKDQTIVKQKVIPELVGELVRHAQEVAQESMERIGKHKTVSISEHELIREITRGYLKGSTLRNDPKYANVLNPVRYYPAE